LAEIAGQRLFAIVKTSGVIHRFVGVAVRPVMM
jgi:hypothetical protein